LLVKRRWGSIKAFIVLIGVPVICLLFCISSSSVEAGGVCKDSNMEIVVEGNIGNPNAEISSPKVINYHHGSIATQSKPSKASLPRLGSEENKFILFEFVLFLTFSVCCVFKKIIEKK
jgi:hypothetical protein